MFESIISNVKNTTPLVHSITNYVTVNDCANVVLASGGSPIMADDISEAAEITSICSSLVLNIGTLNDRTIKSMLASGKKANALSLPVIFDPVGAGASALRNETALALLKSIKVAVIRGNISEIKFLAKGVKSTKGVDAAECDCSENIENVISLAKGLAETTGAVVAVTGVTDVVTDGTETYVIKNGHAMMSRITGSGCMLSVLTGCYCGANPADILNAAAAAAAVMGLSGELAYKRLLEIDGGINTYRALLIDFIGKISYDMLKDGIKIERR